MRLAVGICVLVIGMCVSACIEPFDPEIEGFEDSLVVEGHILDGDQPATVRLSRSFGFDEDRPTLLSGAQVGIRDDQGGETMLAEVSPGMYQSDTSQYQGTPGASYQLFFETAAGEKYESDWVLMKKGVEIEKIDWQMETQVVDNRTSLGVQFYLSSYDPEGLGRYYRWDYVETWEFRVPFPALGLWNIQTTSPDWYPFSEIPDVCWLSDTSSQIIFGSTIGLSADRIVDQPIRFASTRGNYLQRKYSILVKQYVISEETYSFYQNLKQVTEDLGTLFDPIPSEIIGNIRNVNDPDEAVIGLFSADGYSEKRVFVRRNELPAIVISDIFSNCDLDTIPSAGEMNTYVAIGGTLAYEVYDGFGLFLGYAGSSMRCTDCRETGTIERPDFWE